MDTILNWTTVILLAVYLAGVVVALWRGGPGGWRAALLWPVILLAFALFWRKD